MGCTSVLMIVGPGEGSNGRGVFGLFQRFRSQMVHFLLIFFGGDVHPLPPPHRGYVPAYRYLRAYKVSTGK